MKLALRLLVREWRAGELRLLFGALLVAVAAITTVSFFTNRVQHALNSQTNQLLAADLVLIADHPIAAEFAAQAASTGMRVAHTLAFPSMVVSGQSNQFVEVKAVSPAYPLRGELSASQALFAPAENVTQGPSRDGLGRRTADADDGIEGGRCDCAGPGALDPGGGDSARAGSCRRFLQYRAALNGQHRRHSQHATDTTRQSRRLSIIDWRR